MFTHILALAAAPLAAAVVVVGSYRAAARFIDRGDGPGERARRALRVLRRGAILAAGAGVLVIAALDAGGQRPTIALAVLVLPWLALLLGLARGARPAATGAARALALLAIVQAGLATLDVSGLAQRLGVDPRTLAGALLLLLAAASRVLAADARGQRLVGWGGGARFWAGLATAAYGALLSLALGAALRASTASPTDPAGADAEMATRPAPR